MKQIHFFAVKECGRTEYIKDWVNWDGEVPMTGDCVLIHFGDNNEEEYKYRVVGRVIDGRRSKDIDIIVRLIKD